MDAIKIAAGVERILKAANAELKDFSPVELQSVFLSAGDTLGRIITAEAMIANLSALLKHD